jgi:hypothetical protein
MDVEMMMSKAAPILLLKYLTPLPSRTRQHTGEYWVSLQKTT